MASMVSMVGAGFSYGARPSPSTAALKGGRGGGSFGAQFPFASSAAAAKRVVAVRAETINPEIRKNEEKVVDSVPVAELAKPVTAYCRLTDPKLMAVGWRRCWRSGTFPLCDGSHMKHNKATGDNVGPLLLKK